MQKVCPHSALRVSNREAETQSFLARSNLYCLNGGLFRPVWLIKTGTVHIHPDLGSSGVYLTPRNITNAQAELGIDTWVCNPLAASANVTLRQIITAPDGKPAGSVCANQTISSGTTAKISTRSILAKPTLWSLGHAAMYTVRTELLVEGRLSDTVTERTGLRNISWSNNRFELNGREVQFFGE